MLYNVESTFTQNVLYIEAVIIILLYLLLVKETRNKILEY